MRIAFSGKMAAGKTTAAKHLIDKHNYQKFAMADIMKAIEYHHGNTPSELWYQEIQPLSEYIAPKDLSMIRGVERAWIQNWIIELMHKHKPMPDKKNRSFLQELGNGLRESYHHDVWVNTTLHLIELFSDGNNIVIDDIRYPNEVRRLQEEGFIVIRLVVSEEIQKSRYLQTYGSIEGIDFKHFGEVALDNFEGFDYIIDANTSIEEMLNTIDQITEEVKQ